MREDLAFSKYHLLKLATPCTLSLTFFQTDGVHRMDTIRAGGDSPETLSEAVKVLKAQYVLKAIEVHHMPQAIIFCRTKLDMAATPASACTGTAKQTSDSATCRSSRRAASPSSSAPTWRREGWTCAECPTSST